MIFRASGTVPPIKALPPATTPLPPLPKGKRTGNIRSDVIALQLAAGPTECNTISPLPEIMFLADGVRPPINVFISSGSYADRH